MHETDDISALGVVSTQLAYDLASGLWPKDIVLEKHEVSAATWETLRNNPQFQDLCREAYEFWNGKGSQDRRIRTKAKMMLEDSLPMLHRIAIDDDEAAGARLSAISQMEKLSGVSAQDPASAGAGGPSFRIQINLGEQVLSIAGNPPVDAKPVTIDYEELGDVEQGQEEADD